MKKILFGDEARQKIKAGIDKCVNVVKVSLGANGKNVLIYNGQTTDVINDGVSIAREVNVKDEVEMAGIQLAKQCANQTNDDAGDGTTTTLVLLQSILNGIITELQTENPRTVRERLFKEAHEVLGKIKVKKIKNRQDIYNLAFTSSLNDRIATIIANIYDELGKDAQVSIEEIYRDALEKEITKGIKFESQRADDRIVSSEDKVILEDCNVIIKDKVESVEDIKLLLAQMEKRKDLVIVANSFARPVLLKLFNVEDINIIPIEYKNFSLINDLQFYVGLKPVDKVIIEKGNTTLIGGKGDVSRKIEEIRELITKEESQYGKDELEKRIANLLGKVAVIKVGKNTDVERIETALKVEDALGSVKGAYEMGYCKGGGLSLKEAGGTDAVYKQICSNMGVADFEVDETVIDSFKTVKCSLLNAISTATSILSAEAALIEINEETTS